MPENPKSTRTLRRLEEIQILEACMVELLELAGGRRALKDLSPRAQEGFFHRPADGRHLAARCLTAARDLRGICVSLGAPNARYAEEPWQGLGL